MSQLSTRLNVVEPGRMQIVNLPSHTPITSTVTSVRSICGIGSSGGRCPSLDDYVAGMGPTDGPSAPPERARVGCFLSSHYPASILAERGAVLGSKRTTPRSTDARASRSTAP